MDELLELEEHLGIQFNDKSLLTRALTHRSFLNENPGQAVEDNERLEFLGDAVLDFLVGAYLYHRFPEMKEGDLTSLRAALVRTETLANFARSLRLGRFLRLGLGEAESGGGNRAPILCAAFEALTGAIYLDHGLKTVQSLVEPLIQPALAKIMDDSLHIDAKSKFQVWAQAQFNITPHYEVIDSSGPDHAKLFRVQALVGDKKWGKGEGRSKQAAAQAAARDALQRVESLEMAEGEPTFNHPL